MQLSKIDTYNALSKSVHIRSMVDQIVTVDTIVETENASYLVSKDGSVFADAESARREISKLAAIFGDELKKSTLRVAIALAESGKGKSIYRFTIVE